jgi:hypothetical protein
VTPITDLKHYNDIRKHVPSEVFRAATTYMSWHNRLTMTAMLEVWEALIVALVYQQKPIDDLQFSGVKSFLDSSRTTPPATVEECRKRSADLITYLSSHS